MVLRTTPSLRGTSCAFFFFPLLALLSLPSTASAQRSSNARLIYLDDDCDTCITVDADAGEFTLLAAGDCRDARTRDKYWILSGDAWCLDDNPSLCVEEGGTLLLSESSSSQWQDWDTDDDGNIVGNSGDCVTASGSALRMSSCGSSNPNQEWQTGREYCDDDDSGNNNDGTLIFLDRECNECLGVERSADDELLTIVECDDSSALRHWALDYLGSSDIVKSWCLANNENLCVAEVGSDLRLRDDSADFFIFNNNANDEIESVDNTNQCVTRVGSIVLMQTCRSNTDQRWTKEEENDWDSVCVSDARGGLVIYNESQCGVCIIASDTDGGSALVEGDCDNADDDRKFFTFQSKGHWCLESDESVCVETDSAGRLTLRDRSNEQRQEWVYDSSNNEIQTSASTDLCVARQSGGSVELETCSRVSGLASSWIMADYVRQYKDDCIRPQGNSPCQYGDLFVLDVNCNLCIGVGSSSKLEVVDCANALDIDKLWDFDNNGLWRTKKDQNLCVGPDLQLQECVEGRQSLMWTYSDTSQIGNTGQRKIAKWSDPNKCIVRRGLGSDSLELASCSYSPTAFSLDWGYETNTCDYKCAEVMSAGDEEKNSPRSGVGWTYRSFPLAVSTSIAIIGVLII
uniref:Ricin B lectin domain-containing protein n=1 Tax=Minutocellus polymorphus TaxID=265543 RepID=A0A7S0B226_9STRA|mmetsp:Transcript_9546/g.15850  ORF Transcript_9546/g.15850 Transcript_9546/m.15850 type:complete len:630 (+) Transcript_9546:70-1959(+)